MDVSQAIQTRRSIRKYQQRPVSHEVIEEIAADAAYAPSWKNTQIARYVLVEDRTTIDRRYGAYLCDRPLGLRARRLVLDAEGGGL